MTKKLVFGLLIYCFTFVIAGALVANGQRPDPSGQGRYVILPTNDIFDQPQYSGPSSLDGLGKKTAGELGLAGKQAWNEYPNGPKLIVLSASAVIFYDTGSMQPIYLDGCHVAGRYRPNRIKLVEEVQVVEKEKIVEKRVEVPVPGPTVVKEVPGPTVTQNVPVYPECDEGTLYDTKTRQCVKVKNHNTRNMIIAAAAGAGGMYVACRVGKFCGTRTRIITNILTSAPKIQPRINPRPPLDPNGNPTGTPIPTRPRIEPNYYNSTSTIAGGTTSTSSPTTVVRQPHVRVVE